MHALMYLSLHRRASYKAPCCTVGSQGSPWSEMRGPPAAWAVSQERMEEVRKKEIHRDQECAMVWKPEEQRLLEGK